MLALYSATTTTIPHFTLASDLFFGLNPVKIPISMMAIPVLPGFLYLKKKKEKQLRWLDMTTRNKSSFTYHKPNHIIICKQSQQKHQKAMQS